MKWKLFLACALSLTLGFAVVSRMERPGLAQESWTSIYYPQAALGSVDELSFTTQLTLYNPRPESVTAIPLFISTSGEEQSWEPVTLGPNESGLLTLESDGPLSVGQLQLSTSGPIGESLKYVIVQSDGRTREEISVGSTEAATEFMLPVNNDGIHRSAFAVANPGSTALNLSLTLLDSEGFIVQEAELNLPEQGQMARYVHEIEGFAFVKDAFMGSLRIQSSSTFTAMGLAENHSDNHLSSLRPFSPSNTEGADQASESSFVANYPQSAYGFQVDSGLMVSTRLTVFSPHQEEVTVRALFFDHTGKLQQEVSSVIPPNGLRIIEPNAANLIVGQAQLTADRPIGQVLTYLFTNTQGRIVEEISVREATPSKQYSVPVEISESHTSSFALANVADRPLTIQAFLVNEKGEKDREIQFDLGRGEQRARFISEVFSGLDSFTGTAQFWSNEGALVLMGLSTNRNDQHLSSLAGTPAVLDSDMVEVTLRAGNFNLNEVSGTATFLLGDHEVQAQGHTTFWVPEGEYKLNIISPSHWPEVLDVRRGFFGEHGPIRDTADPPDKPVIVSIGSNGFQEELVGLLMDDLGIYEIPNLPFDAFYTKENVFQFLVRDDGYKYEFVNKQAIVGILENATGIDPTLGFQRWREVVNLQNVYGKGLHRIQFDQEAIPEAIAAASQAQGTLILQVSNSAFSDVELQSDQSLISSAIASVPVSEGTKWKTYAGRLLEASAGVKGIVVSASGQEAEVVSVEDLLANGENDLDLEQGLSPVAEKLTGLALHLRKGTFLTGHFVEEPSIRLEKSTNGEDADTPPGPSIQQGNGVSWAYEVINTGNVLLSKVSVSDDREGPIPCDRTTLDAGESMICTFEGVAEIGQYSNVGTVSAESVLGTKVSSDDPSHYLGIDSCYLLTLSHTGSGSDPVPSPESSEGCSAHRYFHGQTVHLTASPASGWAIASWINTNNDSSTSNENQVTMPGEDLEVTVNYVEEVAEITIEKFTNGQDADTPPGPSIAIGDEVRWTFEVANTGNITLTDIIVTDDQLGSICSQEELGPAIEMTCVVTATAQLGQYENIGSAVGSPQGGAPDVTDIDPSHYLGVTDEADLMVTKFTPAVEIFEGDILPYTIEVANLGPALASSVVITDTLPVGTVFISAPDQCSYGSGQVVCGLGDLEAESVLPEIVIEVEFNATGVITNTVEVAADQNDPSPANDVFVAVNTVAPRVDLSVSKTASTDEVMVGDQFFYTVDALNEGPSVATTVLVTDTLPAEVEYLSASAGCAYSNGAVACALGDLGAQAGASAEIEVRATAAGTLINTVEVTSQESDVNPANNFSVHELTALATEPAIHIEKYTNGEDADVPPGPTLTIGQEVHWEFHVANTGNITLTNVIVTDDQLGTIDCPQVELAPDESTLCSFVGTAAAGQHSNTATVIGTPPGELPDVFDSDPSHYLGIADEADLTVTKSAPPGEVYEGDVLPYLIEVANLGPQVTSSVILTDTLPAGTALVSAPDQCGYSSGEVVCGLGDFEAGSHSQFVIEVEIGTTGFITNSVEVWADQPDPNPANNYYDLVNEVIPRVDLVVSKSASVESIFQGDNFIYFIEVENAGTSVATTVVLTDTLPVQAEYVSSSLGCNHNSGIVVCELGDLAGQAGRLAEIEVQATGGGTLFNTVETAAQEADVNPANNATFHELTALFPEPAVTIEKYTNGQDADLAPGPTILVGEEVGWTYEVFNSGNIALTEIIVNDDREGTICLSSDLGPGLTMTCNTTGTAQLGQYENTATVQATVVQTTEVITAADVSHYFGDAGP